MLDNDTICAVSTPMGEGGIGIIRISGRDSAAIAARIFRPKKGGEMDPAGTHYIRYGHVVDPATGGTVDEALLTFMRSPATYTREDVVEINCHGGMMPLMRTMELLIAAGARQASPGEFTKRAFLNGRIDLAQAEAVMDVIRSKTALSLRSASEQLQGGLSSEVNRLRDGLLSLVASVEAGIDFPEEEIETQSGKSLEVEVSFVLEGINKLLSGFSFGRILREGFATAIVGRPNVGKSSLLNALLKQNRAIVTDVPGTTRDVIEESLNVGGALLRIIDTAGIRETHDMVEQEGVRRSIGAMGNADLVIWVLDGSEPLHDADRLVMQEVKEKEAIAVINKSDLPRKLQKIERPETQIELSCHTGAGLDDLRRAISGIIKKGAVMSGEHAWAVNIRHRTALERAGEGLKRALDAIKSGLSPEFAAVDLREGLDNLGLIVGATYTEDILDRIFSEFCIGK